MTDIILPDVTQEIKDALSKDIKQYDVHTNYGSILGHPCLRFLVYNRLDYDKKPPITVERKMRFLAGEVIEQHLAKGWLEKAGYLIAENNKSISWKEKQIGLRLDFLIRKKGLPCDVPTEVKSMVHYDWLKMESIEDLLMSKKVWHKQYPAQLTLYMLQKGVEYGMFLIIDTTTFQCKHIWVNLDFTYAEELIKKAETINECVAKKKYPDRMPYDYQICSKCDFQIECLPDIETQGADFIDDEEWEGKCARYFDIKAIASEFKKIDDEIKNTFKEKTVVIGKDFKISGKFVDTTEYEYPPEIKDKYRIKKQEWRKSITDLRKGVK